MAKSGPALGHPELRADLRIHRRGPLLVTGLFAVSLALKLWSHEPWRDELQAWSIARASHSLTDLFGNLNYEGHPFLWYALLWPFARLTGDPRAMQVVSLVVATGTAWLVLARAPFAWWIRVAIVFSYFPFYEYGAIARSYGLGMFLTVAACALLSGPRRDGALPALVLGALALTSLYGLMISGAIATAWVTDAWLAGRRPFSRGRAIGLVSYAACAVIAVIQVIPPKDAPFGGSVGRTNPGRVDALTNIWRAMVPLPSRLGASFWESNISQLVSPGRLLSIAAGFGLAVVVVVRVRRSAAAVLLWVSGLIVLEAFSVLRYAGALRHAGTVVLLALAALWLEPAWRRTWPLPRAVRRRVGAGSARPRVAFLDAATALVLVTCLGASVAAALIATYADAREVFSPASAVADDIERAGLESAFIVGYPDFGASAVAAELDRAVWYPNADRFGTFLRWDARRRDRGRASRVVEAVLAREGGPIVFISSKPLPELEDARLLAAYPNTTNEPMWVYVIGE